MRMALRITFSLLTLHTRCHRGLAVLLGILLIVPPNAVGQQQPTPAQPAPAKIEPMAPLPVVQNLKILALAGEGEFNDLERRVMAPLVVEVRDHNDRPVEGATVTFRFPVAGPSATFPNEKPAQTVITNVQGQAVAAGWTARQPGPFKVNITATYRNQMGQATVNMINATRITDEMAKDKRRKRPWWASRKWQFAILAAAGAAAAGILLATRNGGSTVSVQTPPTVTITPGTVTIGGR